MTQVKDPNVVVGEDDGHPEMNSILDQLLKSKPVLLDGAWGTQLQARGLAVGEAPDPWNLTHADRVREVAQAYVDAGSQIILTNTFGANRIRLNESDAAFAERTIDINRAGVEISKQAAGDGVFVFASIGPSGKMILSGDVTPEDLQETFTEQAEALARGGADALVVETMSDPEEARIAVKAAKSTGLPVVACMAYESGADLDRTMMGTTPEQAAEVLAGAGADAIGANCGQGIAGFIPICQSLKAVTGLPIWMKANAGLPEWIDGKVVYRMTAEEFAGHARSLIAAGAAFIGGCCGTSPAFIRDLKAVLDRD
jgi:5-methyltetrahydrofolate--homocysteine methyltransferase